MTNATPTVGFSQETVTNDPVNHPKHYTNHPSGVECIQVTEHMGFNLGNAVKYIWRCDLKLDAIEDLKKAEFYIKREIEKREKAAKEAAKAAHPSSGNITKTVVFNASVAPETADLFFGTDHSTPLHNISITTTEPNDLIVDGVINKKAKG